MDFVENAVSTETIEYRHEAEAVGLMHRLYDARHKALASGKQVPAIESLLDLFWTVSQNGKQHNYSFKRWIAHVHNTMKTQ